VKIDKKDLIIRAFNFDFIIIGDYYCNVKSKIDLILLGIANIKDNHEETALISASYYGKLEVVEYLIGVGVDINAKDDNGITALIQASHKGYLEVVKCLIEAGADVNAKNNNGNPALMYATNYVHLEVVKYLKSVGAK